MAATHPQRVECALSCLEKAKRIHAPASLSSNGAELAFLFNLLWLRVSVQMLSYFVQDLEDHLTFVHGLRWLRVSVQMLFGFA